MLTLAGGTLHLIHHPLPTCSPQSRQRRAVASCTKSFWLQEYIAPNEYSRQRSRHPQTLDLELIPRCGGEWNPEHDFFFVMQEQSTAPKCVSSRESFRAVVVIPPPQTPACGLPNPLGPRLCPPTPTPPACCEWTGEGQADKETSSPASSPASSPVHNAQCTCILRCDFVPSPPPRSGKFAHPETPLVLPGHFFFLIALLPCPALPCAALPWPPLCPRLEPFLAAIDGPVCACAVLRLWVTLTPTRCPLPVARCPPRAFVRQVVALPAPAPAPQRRPAAAGHST